MKNNIILQTAAALALILMIAACGNTGNKAQKLAGTEAETTDSTAADSTSTDSTATDSTAVSKYAFDVNALPEDPMFEINTTEGTIIVQLYKETPLHRDNFVKLASERYYDSTLFHRVIRGFMIQGGDPYTKNPANYDLYGTGGPDYTIPAEILPQFKHKKGALCAARKGNAANPRKNSSGSQFYIVQDSLGCAHLDGEYTIFGETVDGLNVIDRIASIRTDHRDVPLKEVRIISILPLI